MQDLAHESGDSGLAGNGAAQKHAVQRRRFGLMAEAGALARQHVDQLTDLYPDRGKADHAVQLGQGAIQRARSARHRDYGWGRGVVIPILDAVAVQASG